MNWSKRKYVLSAGAIASVGALYVLLLFLEASDDSKVLHCLKGLSCTDVYLSAGSSQISKESLERYLKIAALRRGASLVSRSRILVLDNRKQLFLEANCGKGPELFMVGMVQGSNDVGVICGSLTKALLTIKNRFEHPEMKMLGEQLERIADDWQPIALELELQGVQQIDIAGAEQFPIRDSEDALRQMASYSRNTPIRILRP